MAVGVAILVVLVGVFMLGPPGLAIVVPAVILICVVAGGPPRWANGKGRAWRAFGCI
jgi:hypothetical protein